MYSLERKTLPLNINNVPHADAIVVLTAGRTRNTPEYNGEFQPDALALVRLRYAAHLHQKTKLPILIAGGSTQFPSDLEPLSLTMQRGLANDFGIQAKWVETISHNTYTSARHSKEILASAGIESIVLVTDAAHMYRAALAFRKFNFTVIEGPTHFSHRSEISFYSFLPSSGALWRSSYALYQWLGIIWYRFGSH